ncbi:TatD family hydrolase [Marinomonas sp. 15G1-11]|uniref:TatD family hydrolase n=1 Tax=Marinomonas phaeophyticola TaxID=3004091 RepID=A0ABT4JV16_9GAMM|nr:TatD family hydrolase [Marinomonas sp. 15G1-11]MCZ2722241.1 TatD family hydrolase [Marinomonas sp. 15G1-11]
MLIDTHCHLDGLDLSPYEGRLDLALDAAVNAGVKQLVSISVDLDSLPSILEFTNREGVYASAGVHPLHTKGLLKDEKELLEFAQHEKVIAIGETGLDYHYESDKKIHQAQRDSFALHLSIAGSLDLPVIVHTREARVDTIELLKEYGNIESGGVLHCFTESYEMAKQALDENYLISISGIVTFKNAQELRDVVKKIPLDRLLVETDAPYLAPIPFRGKKNEPKYVAEVAQFVADIKGVRYEALLETTANNFYGHFKRASALNTLKLIG